MRYGKHGDCGERATRVVEGYGPRGALARIVYACGDHVHAAQEDWLEGLTVSPQGYPTWPHACGDYTDRTRT